MAEKYYTDYKKGEYKSYDAYYRGWANIGLNSSSTDDKYGIYVGDVGIGKKAGTTTSWSSGRVRKTTVTVDGTSYTKSASNAIKWDYDDGTHNKTIGNVGKTVMIDKGTSPKTISLKIYSAYCEGHSSYAWYFTVSKTWSITIPSKSVTVTYNANGGSNAPSSVKQTCDKAFSLGGGCTRTNYNFLGWSTDANATKADYTSGESVQFTSNTTLYAVWELGFNSASITDIKAYRVNETPTSATPSVANDGTMGFVRFTVKNGVNETHDAPQVAFKVGDSSFVATVNTDGDYYYAYTEDGFIPSTSSADVAINLTSAYTSDSSVTKTVTQGTFISTETYIWDAYSQNGYTSFAIGGLADSEASKFDCYMDAEFKKTATFDADATFTTVSANALKVGGIEFASDNKVLWSAGDNTGYYMKEDQTFEFSEKVSEQKNGIVLVWSFYSSGTQDYDFSYHFVPKWHVATYDGKGIEFTMGSGTFNYVCHKYCYIYDDKIVGNSGNTKTGTASGITYKNNSYVLRAVLGV